MFHSLSQLCLVLLQVRFKNELERNITIKLGYANAKIYRCDFYVFMNRHFS